MEQEATLLRQFEKDSKWFYENIEKLRKEGFTGKFVAIKNSKTIASNKDIDIVIETLENEKENPAFTFIELVYPEGYTLLL